MGETMTGEQGTVRGEGRHFIITLLLKMNLILKSCDRKNHLCSLYLNVIKKTSYQHQMITLELAYVS